jgi:hypothetical protein
LHTGKKKLIENLFRLRGVEKVTLRPNVFFFAAATSTTLFYFIFLSRIKYMLIVHEIAGKKEKKFLSTRKN